MSIIKKRLLNYSEDQLPEFEVTCQDTTLFCTSPLDLVAGRIISLQMTNFMCHSNLELRLNNRINFITGRNGSGKSAIMAALIVVLGGSASITGRGSGVGDFIKKGESWAKVCITLANEGLNTYKKESYGNRITICRNLSKGLSNSYVCKSETGSIVSRKKEEVESIVAAFNLQIKNPICILNQDVARTFLCTTDNTVRFGMFAKATQLENLKAMYMKTLELLIATKQQMKAKEKGIEEASREMAELKDKLTVFASLEKHVHERTKLENEYFWSLVEDEEKKLKVLQSEQREVEKRRQEIVESELNFKRSVEQLEDLIKELGQELEDLIKKKSERSEQRYEIQREAHNIDREIEKVQLTYKYMAARAERQLADINAVKEHLAQSDTLVSQSEAEQRANNEKIYQLSEELAEVRGNLKETQTAYNEAVESRFDQAKNLESIQSDVDDAEQKMKRVELLITRTKANSQNALLKYGQFTPELMAAIDEAAKKNYFSKKPVGPCGLHVSLTGDPKWARAVESVIGGLMNTYCCDNQKDFQTLSRIMDKVCGNKQPPIIISKFLRERHDVTPQKVRVRGLQSVYDVLSFNNDIVFNTFVDQARIETILLMETDEQAASILTHIQNVPKNLRMGVTLHSDQYYPAPNYRTYYGDARKPLRYFENGSKVRDSIKEMEDELKEVSLRFQEKSQEMAKAKEEHSKSGEILKKFEKKLRELRQKESKLQINVNHLKDIEESRPVMLTKLALREELEDLERNYKETEKKCNEHRDTLHGLIDKKRHLLMKQDTIEVAERGAEKEIRKMEDKVDAKKFKLKQMCGKRPATEQQLERVDRKLCRVAEEIEAAEEVVLAKIKSAKDVCPIRINTKKTPVEVQKLLEKCEMYLKTAEKMTGSRPGIIADYKSKLGIFNNMKKTAGILANAIETLTRIGLKKEQRLDILQSHTASLVSFYFQATLQTRGYDGQLKVDFENKGLEIEVKPKDALVARKDSKTLSGGERSYATVSFILAIWKVIQMPFYFLDEFDVFMDKVNRKVIMDLLLEHAHAQPNKQFVFITPQDISGIQSSESLSIFKLPDPEQTFT